MTAPESGAMGSRHRSSPAAPDGSLLVGFVTLLLVAAASSLVTFLALQVQAAATNYISAESLWAKGRAEAVQALYAYTVTGEEPELRRARDALAVPLTFHAARRALEASPTDRAAARTLLQEAGVAPEDASRMVYLYPAFARMPIMRDGIEAWRDTDAAVLRLAGLADELEAAWAAGGGAEMVLPLRRELAVANAILRPLETAFTRNLVRGSHRLRTTLLGVTVASYLLMAIIAAALIGRAQRKIRLNERNLRATYEQAAVGMVRLDRTGRLVDANDAFCELLGCDREAVQEMTLTDILHEEDLPPHGRPLALMERAESGGGAIERRFVRSDGSTLWGRVTISQVELGGNAGTHLFMIVEDVTEAHRLSQELDYRARHDALTGLINRFEIERRLEAALASGNRHGDTHTLCFLDLDQFKIVNDTSGHDAGDHLLRQVAALLGRSVRTNDTVGRLGGDEFAILLDRADAGEARRVVEGLRQALADHPFRWEDRTHDVTCSIGYVEITDDEEDAGSWLRKADIACYLAKEAGRNRVHAYIEGDEALIEREGQMAWVGRIRDAIAHDRLTLLAQRIVPARGGDDLVYELLLRLVDADGRHHHPGAFMPAAERFGLVPDLDRWVVDEVLGTLARHPRHLSALGRCHVNLSAQAVSDESFCRFLLERLDRFDAAGADPCSKLCFEITETAAIRSLTDALTLIEALRARGCEVALDDFGTGLSSFAHLKTLPVDLVKIDGLFVRDIVASDLDRAIVRSIHEVTRVLGRATIAEFVEDDAIRDVLTDIGIDHLQGVAIHAPQPWDEVLAEG